MKSTAVLIITSLLTLTNLSSAKAKIEISPLTADAKMWDTNSRNFTDRFSWLDWESGNKGYEHMFHSQDLTLWGEAVEAVKLKETRGVMSGLNIEILNQETSILMNPKEFKQRASKWKTLLDSKLGSSGKVITPISTAKIKHTRIAWNCEECVVILSANIGVRPDRLLLSFQEKDAGLASVKLKGQQDKEFIADNKEKIASANVESGDSNLSESDDPNASKEEKEIRAVIREISARKAPDGVSKGVQDAVNLLNVYRYLSSVPYDVKADKKMIEASEDAAKICKEKGQLSHDFGHSTDKCNLAMNSGNLSMESSVMQYMKDSGANNRERRGHRRWCLNHKMGKTGFGIDGAYSAMYSLDQSARGGRKDYSYPGHGFYPIKYLHGNGWSYHIAEGRAPADCTVEVWKLSQREDKLPSWGSEPEGKKLPCAYVNTYSDTIIFEPESDPITKKGYYLVRLKGSGFKEQYIVKLF